MTLKKLSNIPIQGEGVRQLMSKKVHGTRQRLLRYDKRYKILNKNGCYDIKIINYE